MQSSAGLVSQEKRLMNSHMCDPNQEQLNFCNSGASLSPGASSIMAAAYDTQAHLHHHHADSKNTLGALSRANYRGRLYNTQQNNNSNNVNNSDDIEKDSITNSDTTKDLNIMRSKKLSWQHEDFQVTTLNSISNIICLIISFVLEEQRCEWINGFEWIYREQFNCIFLSFRIRMFQR